MVTPIMVSSSRESHGPSIATKASLGDRITMYLPVLIVSNTFSFTVRIAQRILKPGFQTNNVGYGVTVERLIIL